MIPRDGARPLDLAPAPGARRSSSRVALRMARRDISRHKGRAILIILLIMLPVAGMTGAATLYQSSLRTPGEIVRYELGNTQARFTALPAPNGDSIQDPQDDAILASTTGSIDPGFVRSAPEDLLPPGYEVLALRQFQLTTAVGDALVSLQGLQVDALNPAFAGKYTLLAGRAPDAGAEVLVSPGLLDRFDLEFGGEFTTSAGTFVPVGTLRDADASDKNSVVYLGAGQVPAEILDTPAPVSAHSASYYLVGPEPVTWQQVREANSRGVGVLSRTVVLDPPPLDQQVVPGAQPRGLPPERIAAYATYGLVGALAMLEVGLLAGAAFSVGAKRQVRELALLAASGAEAPTIRAVVTAGGIWLGTIAVTAGAAAGVGAAAAVVLFMRSAGSARMAGVHPDLLLTGIAMLMGLAACILAALAPAHMVARQAVLGALKSGRAPAGSGKRSSITGAVLLVAAAGLLTAGRLLAESAADPDLRAEQLPAVTGLLICGAVLAVVALVLLTGRFILLLASTAQRLPLALRMAARDSARNRGRTVPAVAAVLAAATLAAAGLVLSASQQAGLRESHTWRGLENQAILPLVVDRMPAADGSVPPPVEVDPQKLASALSGVLGTVEWTQVLTAAGGTRGCPDGPQNATVPARTADASCLAYTLARPAGNECPVTAKGRVLDPRDWRCRGSMARDTGISQSVLVGGPDVIRAALGRDAVPDVLAVLDAGGIVVTNPAFVRDGKAVLEGRDVRSGLHAPPSDLSGPKPATSEALPAAVLEPVVAVPYYGIVSPATAGKLDLRPAPAGLLVQLSEYPAVAQVDAAAAAAAGVYGLPMGYFAVEPGISKGELWMAWSIVAAGALITLSAAGITTGLALADARTDHVTLAGIGASPRLRKALAGAQALLTAGLGAVLGTVAGAVPAVLVAASTDTRTAVDVPWLQLLALVAAVPMTASALAWLFTRAALPVSRRGLAA